MNGIVILRGTVVALDSDVGITFVSDCARYIENLLSEDALKARYDIDEACWVGFANNSPLRQAVEAEKNRRIANGEAARERAQQLFATAPVVLGDILNGEGISPRHKIESARELRQIAANGPEAAPVPERFQITIDLSGDVLRFDKSVTIDANDVDPNDTGTALKRGLPATSTGVPATTNTTNNSGDGDDESV